MAQKKKWMMNDGNKWIRLRWILFNVRNISILMYHYAYNFVFIWMLQLENGNAEKNSKFTSLNHESSFALIANASGIDGSLFPFIQEQSLAQLFIPFPKRCNWNTWNKYVFRMNLFINTSCAVKRVRDNLQNTHFVLYLFAAFVIVIEYQ